MYKKPFFFVCLAFLVYLGWGISTLTNFITADEHFWLPNYGSDRIQAYWQAVGEHDWEDTRINDKPGITLAYFSGIALPFSQDLIKRHIVSTDGVFVQYDPEVTKQLNFNFRFPLLLFNGLFIFYFFWLLKKLSGSAWIAAWSAILMYLSPVLLGMNQIVNPDTLFWVFGLGTLLTFQLYLKERQRKLVVITAVLFGLMLASKYVGVLLIPFFMVMAFLDYLFGYEKAHEDGAALGRHIREDLSAYWIILLGGTLLFAVLMPASFVDPEVLYESTIGFPGMMPIFLAVLAVQFFVILDSLFFRNRLVSAIIRFLCPARSSLEKGLYAVLLVSVLFVLFNWTFQNSLYDLTDIPFDIKTKDSFTEDYAFLERYAVEFVALTFSLTPFTLFALFFAWIYGIFAGFKERLLPLTLSAFMLVFYFAVIEQGLLVTARYSIVLFPVALILAAYGLDAFFRAKPSSGRMLSFGVFAALVGFFTAASAFMAYYANLGKKEALNLKLVLNTQMETNIALFLAAGLAIGLALYLIFRLASKWRLPAVLLSAAFILISLVPLAKGAPHFFVYTSDLLPKNYIITGTWGYGGYEAAEYLNSQPDAKNMTIWADAYGVCEFFAGKCIRSTHLDVTKYYPDYLYRTRHAALSPKFPHNTEDIDWRYVIDGRDKNYVRLYRNYPLSPESMQELEAEKEARAAEDRAIRETEKAREAANDALEESDE
jgi:hypothetical protein